MAVIASGQFEATEEHIGQLERISVDLMLAALLVFNVVNTVFCFCVCGNLASSARATCR
jgi:hypothetical protein